MNNFEQAIKQAIIEYFEQKDIGYVDDSFNSIFHQYMNILDKYIQPKPYTVKISSQLQEKMKESTELSEKINYFKSLFQSGNDVHGHQSRHIYRAEFYDKLLMLWNIHHLHLNCTEANTDDEMRHNRSDTLLFVLVKDDKVYFIDIESHNKDHVFSMFRLLEIIQDNWEYLLFKQKDVVDISFIADDSMLETLFKGNLNYYIFKIKDSFYSVGINTQTMAGTSINNQLAYGDLQAFLRRIYPEPPICPTNIKCVLHYSKSYFCDLEWNEGNRPKRYTIVLKKY